MAEEARKRGQAMTHDANPSADRAGSQAGGTDRWLAVVGLHRRGPYGFTLWVSALTAVLGCAILAGGFAATWNAFDTIRDYADRNIANEDSYYAYADGGKASLLGPGFVVFALLLALALLVLTLLHTAHAAGAPHATRVVGRRMRRRLPAALAVNALTGLAVGAVLVAGLMLWTFVERGEMPGVEPTPLHGTATPQYTLVGWVLPIAVMCLGPLLYSRLSVATAETVLEHRSPFVALYRSWVLTRRARRRTLGMGALTTAVALLVFLLARYAAAPLAHVTGLGMLWLSDDNVWITGVLMKILPTAVALLLLPPVVMPLVCASVARLHGDLRAEEDAERGAAAVGSKVSGRAG